MKLRDSFGPTRPEGPTRETAKEHDRGNRAGEVLKAQGVSFGGQGAYKADDPVSGRPLATANRTFRRHSISDPDLSTFQDRLRMGKAKLCTACGGVMRKSSRMVLSWIAGLAVIVIGMVLMVLYGLATNFYQPPWYLRFLLPAGYYVGSILIGVGILFFFVREKVWYCPKCRDMQKR